MGGLVVTPFAASDIVPDEKVGEVAGSAEVEALETRIRQAPGRRLAEDGERGEQYPRYEDRLT